jgi:hypothetical protein
MVIAAARTITIIISIIGTIIGIGIGGGGADNNYPTTSTCPDNRRSNSGSRVWRRLGISSNDKIVVQPTSANNPMAGCSTSWSSV